VGDPLDVQAVVAYLRTVVEPGKVVELRILNVVDNPKYPAFTISGYFDHDHLDALAEAACKWTAKAEGCYVTINPVVPDLLARAANRAIARPKHTTTDAEIARRVGLVFDADPKRPAGVSANASEKTEAHERMLKLVNELTRRGWPAPITADSGNGYHARYRIDLPNDDESHNLVGRVLKAAAALFSDDKATIDTSLSNASRLIKLYGTLARKGDDTYARPHRLSKALSMPDDFGLVPRELLESFADEYQPAATNHQPCGSASRATARDGASPETRARAYVFASGFPDSVDGEHGHNPLYRCACELIDGFGLDRNSALPILQDWNQAKAKPPESEKQVLHKIDNAIKNHPHPSLRRLNAGWSGGSATATAVLPGDPPIELPKWPADPDAAAYSGLAGEIVRTIEPQSEADPAALLAQLLITFGSIVGRRAHIAVGSARHYGNEFGVLVGQSSVSRKGTSWNDVRQFIAPADSNWRHLGGLSSGEGLIYAVRDQLLDQVPVKDKGRIVDYQTAVIDPGVADKRLLVYEPEFGGVLKALGREGNKLSAVIRQAWDGDILASLTKGSPHRATDAHISIVAHITADELTQLLTACDQANGVANRILWLCCRRSKLLPYGGRLAQQVVDRLKAKVADAIAFAKGVNVVDWTAGAKALWEAAYPRLTALRPGVFGMVTSRAEAHVVRLALLYALLDRYNQIEPIHLRAALALWDYCERSARSIFGDALGDRDAQAILNALRAAPAGLTRTEIRRRVFHDNKDAQFVASKLGILHHYRLARFESIATQGRPVERWFSVTCDVINVYHVESPPADTPTSDPFHVENVYHVTRTTENGPPEVAPAPAEREVLEERAAILEYDAGMSRPEAERRAGLSSV
jgi:hypothetical protein